MSVLNLQSHKAKQSLIQDMETPHVKASAVALIHDTSCVVYGRD